MTSFSSAVKNVLGGRTIGDVSGIQTIPRPWPIFRLVSTSRPARPVVGLQEVVEYEVIPRLVRAHPAAEPVEDSVAESDIPLDAKSAQAFAHIILSRNVDTLGVFVKKLRTRGIGSERLYADLLAPAARLLADLWDQDEISFTEVTIGLGRLQHVVRDLESATPYNGDNDSTARSCLFSPRPGEEQTFGLYMIEELFRWSGWRTWIETAATDAELAADVRCQWFDMFCLSVSRSANIQDVAATIATVRCASRNRELFILVNGRPFIERPELIAIVGADAVASCGRDALHIAGKVVGRLATAG